MPLEGPDSLRASVLKCALLLSAGLLARNGGKKWGHGITKSQYFDSFTGLVMSPGLSPRFFRF